MLEMKIDSIRVSLMNYQRVVILKEKDNNRYLPIWIGPAEADSIAMKLQDVAVPRPLTHDLLDSIICSLGAGLSHVVVSALSDDTFYAKIVLQKNGEILEVDSRPSDAIALAVRAKVAIFVEETVLDKAGILLEQESGKQSFVGQENEEPGRDRWATGEFVGITEDDLQKMSAFREFIDTLDLEDFGKKG